MENENHDGKLFKLTPENMRKLIRRIVNMVSNSTGSFWMAICNSTEHADNQVWTGAKREEEEEAIRDATEHNRKYDHEAVVIEVD